MSYFKHFSIKYKLISIIMLVACIALISGFTLVIINDIRSFKQDMVNNALVNAKLIGEYCITPLDFGYNNAAVDALNKLQTIPEITMGVVFDENGKVFASYLKHGEDEDIPSQPSNDISSFFAEDALHVYLPVISDGRSYGTVYLKSTTIFLKQKIENYLITMVSILIGILIVSYVSALGMQRIISKPILGLVSAANTVSQKTDYTVRVKKEGNDEIGILYDGFNNMLRLIEIRDSELQQKNRELESLINTSPDAIIITDVDNRIIMINNQFLVMSGFNDEKSLKGRNFLDFVQSENVTKVLKELHNILVSGHITGVEFSIVNKDYKKLPVELNASILSDPHNNPKYIINIIRDISDRKILEEKIARLRREQEAFMRHEIKNILFPIQGNAEILLMTDKGRLDDDQKQFLQLIRDDSYHAGQLVDRLKMLQDMENDVYKLNLQKCSLKTFIEKAVQDLAPLSNEYGVIINYNHKDTRDIYLDPDLIQGVFNNLIKNAIEHVQDSNDEKEKIVTITNYSQNGKNIVTINNKGEPVPPEKLKLFFEKFNSDRAKKKDGTGLGTSYAYLVTKAHCGDISVESNKENGTTVTLIFDEPG